MATTTRVLTASVNGTVYTSNANGALEAIDTCHSGATAPTDEVANGKLWLDTTTTPGILKIYNNATWEVVQHGADVTVTGAFTSLGIDDNATSTAITIDASENVGIGTASPSSLFMLSEAIVPRITMLKQGVIEWYIGNPTQSTSNNFSIGTSSGGRSEILTIDNTGNVLVGKTTVAFGTAGSQLQSNGEIWATVNGGNVVSLNRLTSNGAIVGFSKGGATVGSISVTGSATAYNTSSDYRLKENVTPIQGAADTVMSMQPCTYTAIVDGLWYDGFLAHELQEVHPRAVQGTKDAMQDEEYEVTPAVYEDVVTPAVDAVAATYDDEGLELTPAVEAAPETTESTLVTEAVTGTRSVPDMQSVDYSKLTPILTAALQEALAKIEAMEVRLAALEV